MDIPFCRLKVIEHDLLTLRVSSHHYDKTHYLRVNCNFRTCSSIYVVQNLTAKQKFKQKKKLFPGKGTKRKKKCFKNHSHNDTILQVKTNWLFTFQNWKLHFTIESLILIAYVVINKWTENFSETAAHFIKLCSGLGH